ncbi:hexosaminidase [Streptosporangium becharense]|uniref:beta-N-acetylhexosaminidase n=1 Tax=Streptosporangium becharense TaxID=1816182 RepID=A0A7W9IB42_9ACTN|nr:beta-N-acetylhexosaminidase [Streptosporangium becharense]MBB2910782.1 hexosaminidase [Streptosporangium becharense]MBB5817477.1 hexosaminidase [Streptosporangium becharense]
MIIPRPRRMTTAGGSVAFREDLLRLMPDDPSLHEEGYRIDVSPAGIELTAGGPAGRFYGARTLSQLGPAVPYGTIEDRPRFAWRGVMLDVARHFMPKTFVLRLVDLLAEHKLNVLHLHLTDDQGWRLEIKRHPRLTEVGAERGGFYTHEDVREIVAYAAERFVTVVPEIEMPGHAQAAIAAYPHLGNDPSREIPVWSEWGVSEHVLNLEESTIRFCQDVLDEVVELFPSTYVHVGGDECPVTEWERSPAARRRLAELGLRRPQDACAWFIGRMAGHLAEHSRRLVCWDEPDRDPTPGTTVMIWRDERADRGDNEVILAPHTRTYFDYRPSAGPFGGRPAADPGGTTVRDRVLTLADTYAFTPDRTARGVQCQLWTEYMPTPELVEFMALPRMCAFAEVAWGSPGDYPDFLRRLDPHLARLGAMGVRTGPLIP